MQGENEQAFMLENEEDILQIINNSFLSRFIGVETITDISFNGTQLWLKDNEKGEYVPEFQPTKEEIHSLGKAFSNVTGKEYTDAEPILDSQTMQYRINFVHPRMSPYGASMALRVSKPEFAVSGVNAFADNLVEGLLSALVGAGVNILISGITGTGKTELQRLLVHYIDGKIVLIEDTMDSHIKALYPHKNIVSWRTLTEFSRDRKFGFHEGIQAGLRNDPEWIMISETRSSDAYSVVEAGLTGHSIMTTLHAESAGLIISRMLSLIGETRQINEARLGNDLVHGFPIGLQLESETDENGVRRFISEIVEFHNFDGQRASYTSIYKVVRKYDPKTNEYTESYIVNPLSDALLEKLTFKRKIHLVPDVFKSKVLEGVS